MLNKFTSLRLVSPVKLPLLAAALAGGIALLCQAESPALLRSEDRVAICGDSITEHRKYSVMMATYLLACQPVPRLETIQFGWGGETTPMFLKRLSSDVLPFEPTVATVFYGMNDGGYAPLAPVNLNLYRDALGKIVRTFKASGTRALVVGGPGAVDTHWFRRLDSRVYNETLAAFSAAAREVAQAEDTVFVDVHGAMMQAMEKAKAKYGREYPVAGGDGVHPDANGHLIIAYAFLKALGCPGDIGVIDWDWKSGVATVTEGHEILSTAPGTLRLRSTRYPFCLSGDPANPSSTAGMAEFIPFNEDLNRYTLRVRNLGTGKVRVTWGKAAREFAGEDLDRGVNLAAEFVENPFSVPFAKVQEAVTEQQTYETASTKQIMPALTAWREWFPADDCTLADVPEKIIGRWREFAAVSSRAVAPVEHSLRVELLGAEKP